MNSILDPRVDTGPLEITDLPPELTNPPAPRSFFAPGTFRISTMVGFWRWLFYVGSDDPNPLWRVATCGAWVFAAILEHGVIPQKYPPNLHLHGHAETVAQCFGLVVLVAPYIVWVEWTMRPRASWSRRSA